MSLNLKLGIPCLIIFLFIIIFSAKSEIKLRSFYECENKDYNFEITQNDLTRVKLMGGEEYVASATKNQKLYKKKKRENTFQWGRIIVSESIQIRYFQVVLGKKLHVYSSQLSEKELASIIKIAKEDKVGNELESLKAKIFYSKKPEYLGRLNCEIKNQIQY
jgi:hypothetical protein